jgi:hypothetical protein
MLLSIFSFVIPVNSCSMTWFFFLTTILVTFQTTYHVNQNDANTPFVLQLMSYRRKFYVAIVKEILFIIKIEITLATKFASSW